MNIAVLLIVILLFVLVGALPVFPHSMGFGYGLSGVVGIIRIKVDVTASPDGYARIVALQAIG